MTFKEYNEIRILKYATDIEIPGDLELVRYVVVEKENSLKCTREPGKSP